MEILNGKIKKIINNDLLFIASCIQIKLEIEKEKKIFKINEEEKEIHKEFLINLFLNYDYMKNNNLIDSYDIEIFKELNNLIKNDKDKNLKELINISNFELFLSIVEKAKKDNERNNNNEINSEDNKSQISENEIKINLKNNYYENNNLIENKEIININNNNNDDEIEEIDEINLENKLEEFIFKLK
ncbi:hypothetical protein Mgra_00009296 [Meloidogyne graminicola]|uniref:Uncharacterized protein n=1 Tax=Meloidogyne graminicola TaxID=189291 RepID=A0A8S9ZC39_9BILA|nr:hypothetical protein Mgra_00009296 [Meloidogyne graminicola]